MYIVIALVIVCLGYLAFITIGSSIEIRKTRKIIEAEESKKQLTIASYEAGFKPVIKDFEKLREELSDWLAKDWDHEDLLSKPIEQTNQAHKIADAFCELYEYSDRASLTGAKSVVIEKLNQVKQNVRDIENIFRVIEISDNPDVDKVMSETLENELSENDRLIEKITLLLAELTCFVNNNGIKQDELFEVNKDLEIDALTNTLRKINHPPKIGEEH